MRKDGGLAHQRVQVPSKRGERAERARNLATTESAASFGVRNLAT